MASTIATTANTAADSLAQHRALSVSIGSSVGELVDSAAVAIEPQGTWKYHHAGGCMMTCVTTYKEFDEPLGRAEEHNMTLKKCKDQASVEPKSKYMIFFKQPYGETHKYSCIWYDAARKECADSSAMACNNGRNVTQEYQSEVYMRTSHSNHGLLERFLDRSHADDDFASGMGDIDDLTGKDTIDNGRRVEVAADGALTDVTGHSDSVEAVIKGVWKKDHDGGCMRVCDQTHTEKDKPLGRAQEHVETVSNCKTMASTDARTKYLVYLVKNGKGECLWYDSQKTDCGRRGSIACELDVDVTTKYNARVYRLDKDDDQPEK